MRPCLTHLANALRGRPAAFAGCAATVLVVASCAPRREAREEARPLPVDVYADTGRTGTLPVERPPEPPTVPDAAVWLARVSPERLPADLPPVEPVADSLVTFPPSPPSLTVDENLRPPLPRVRGALVVPAGARGSVELDVRVDERGEVSEVQWAAGSREPPLVSAAIECARGMRFYPAMRAGRPVAVWCRQRFDFGGPGP